MQQISKPWFMGYIIFKRQKYEGDTNWAKFSKPLLSFTI